MNEKGLLGPHACKTLYLWPDLARTIKIALHKKFFKASFCATQKSAFMLLFEDTLSGDKE